MKKIFMILAMASLLVLASSCGSRQAKSEATEATEQVEAVADSVATVDAAADTTAVVAE